VLLFDVNNYAARQAAAEVNVKSYRISSVIDKHTPVQGLLSRPQVLVVPSGKPVIGEVCPV
jgi:hypothetical protein